MKKKKENMIVEDYYADGGIFPTEVKYDNTKYKIDCDGDSITIRRASDDNELKKIYIAPYTPYITQVNKNGKTHFVIITTSYNHNGVHLIDYVYYKDKLERDYYTDSSNVRKINDSLYLIDYAIEGKNKTSIYNLEFESEIHEYIRGRKNEDLRLDENYVMVVDKIVGKKDEEDENEEIFEDYLTYGIDLDTYEIVTPIYSTFHKEYFNMDSTECFEEAMKINAETQEKRKSLYIGGKYNQEFANTFKRNK